METPKELSERIGDERLSLFIKSPLAELVRWARQQGYSFADDSLKQLNEYVRLDYGTELKFRENIWSGGTYITLE